MSVRMECGLMVGLLIATMGIASTAMADAAPDAAMRAASGSVAVLATGPSALLAIDQNRTTVVERIVAQWGDALTRSRAGINVDQFRSTLQAMRSDYLLAASVAGSLEGVRDVMASSLIGQAPVGGKPGGTKILGDSGDDLVYTPVVPCRLADTRVAGGPIAANTSRDFKVWVASGGFTAQGGNAGNCNVPANPAAVALNLTVVNPGGFGNLIAYPTGGTVPNTSTLNFQNGTVVLANAAIIPACVPNCTNQVTVKANGPATDLVIDIVGYFAAPVATALDCTTVQATVNIPAGVSSTQVSTVATCTAGYTLTGGGCGFGDSLGNATTSTAVLLNRSTHYFDGVNYTNQWSCAWTNTDAVNAYKGFARAVCCRVPGR